MNKHIFTLLILLGFTLAVNGQTIKTGVLVIGNSSGAVSAAVQSARSGAKTVLLTQSAAINPSFTEADLSFLQRIKDHYSDKKKSAQDSVGTPITLAAAPMLLKNISDTVKNLTIINNDPLSKIEEDGKGWEIRLKGGQKIKADAVVDATEKLSIASMLNIDATKTIVNTEALDKPFTNKLYRSTVGLAYTDVKKRESPAVPIPLGALIPADTENFIVVPKTIGSLETVSMSAGQAAGTIASYCAFFKTTTKNINVRVVQGELLAFGARPIPFADIKYKDPNALAFQRIALSGLLKPAIGKEETVNGITFDTSGVVRTEDLRPAMKEFYSRSQIWFADNKNEVLSIENAISLFKFTAARGDELEKEIKNGWKESFHFTTEFDLKRPITRKEFAVLADRYLQPYNVRVDLSGNLLS